MDENHNYGHCNHAYKKYKSEEYNIKNFHTKRPLQIGVFLKLSAIYYTLGKLFNKK